MAIDIHITTTPRQDNKLTIYLDRANASRIASGLPPYATISDLLKDFLIENARNLVKSPDIEDAEKVKEAYINATDSVQNQVRSLLGV